MTRSALSRVRGRRLDGLRAYREMRGALSSWQHSDELQAEAVRSYARRGSFARRRVRRKTGAKIRRRQTILSA